MAHRIQTSLFKFDMWSTWLQTDIDRVETMMGTYNALTVAAALMAGIQGRIISFTMTLPRNHLGRTSNIFAFAGLMLDIISAFSGVIHAFILQRRINKSMTILTFVAQTKAATEAANRRGLEDQLLSFGIQDQRALSHRVAFLENEMRLCREEMIVSVFASKVAVPVPIPHHAIPSPMRTVTLPFELGHTPLISMGLGIRALVISIILFAAEADSLAAEAWISCPVVLFTVMACALAIPQ